MSAYDPKRTFHIPSPFRSGCSNRYSAHMSAWRAEWDGATSLHS